MRNERAAGSSSEPPRGAIPERLCGSTRKAVEVSRSLRASSGVRSRHGPFQPEPPVARANSRSPAGYSNPSYAISAFSAGSGRMARSSSWNPGPVSGTLFPSGAPAESKRSAWPVCNTRDELPVQETSPCSTCTSVAPVGSTATANSVPRSTTSPAGVRTVNPYASEASTVTLPERRRARPRDSRSRSAGPESSMTAPLSNWIAARPSTRRSRPWRRRLPSGSAPSRSQRASWARTSVATGWSGAGGVGWRSRWTPNETRNVAAATRRYPRTRRERGNGEARRTDSLTDVTKPSRSRSARAIVARRKRSGSSGCSARPSSRCSP
jgi:hypothetical protein